MTDPIIPSRVPAGATPDGDGIVIGDGPVRVDVFIDFLCPYCRQFELSSAPALAGLVADQLASLAYHPMNFLDQASTTNYSTRAAAASGCAADAAGSSTTPMRCSSISRPRAGQGSATLNSPASAVTPGWPMRRSLPACPMRPTWTGRPT